MARKRTAKIPKCRHYRWYRYILPKIAATLTHAPRTPVENIEWSGLVTFDAFRIFELLFWRKCNADGSQVIRAESASRAWRDKNGVKREEHEFYTWEALLVYTECLLRDFVARRIPRPKLVRFPVFMPAPRLAAGPTIGHKPIVLLAIAFDDESHTNGDSRTTLTQSHTTSGSNRLLVVFPAIQANVTFSTKTYAGAAMSQVTSQQTQTTGHYLYALILAGPASGTNDIVLSDGSSHNWNGTSAMSYSGCSQTGQPDSFNSLSENASGDRTVSTTVVASNCWLVWSSYSEDADPTSVVSGTIRTQLGGGGTGADSNGTVSTGSQSGGFNWSSTDRHSMVIISIAPLSTVDVTVSASVLSALFAIPSAIVTAIRNVSSSPTPLSATFSIPSPSVSGAANVSPSPLSASFSFPAHDVQIPDVTIQPSSLSATFSFPSPTITAVRHTSVAPSTLAAIFSIPSPIVSVVAHVSLTPSPLTAYFSLPARRREGGIWENQSKEATTWTNSSKASTAWQNQAKSEI